MKLLTSADIRRWDQFSIKQQSISSIDLMDRAAIIYSDWFQSLGIDRTKRLVILAGPGNNGGDALAVARLLGREFKQCEVFRIYPTDRPCSADHMQQLEKLKKAPHIRITDFHPGDLPLPQFNSDDVIIDGLFGSGLSRPLDAWWGSLFDRINETCPSVVSIDIPSGLPADGPAQGPVLQATQTLSFQVPKLSFFMPENDDYTGKWEARSIGLSPDFPGLGSTRFELIDLAAAKGIIRPRKHFSHKGTYGHLLLICGSSGKMGAAILSAKAALRSGAGLLTLNIPSRGETIMQTAVPEAMVIIDPHDYHWSTPVKDSRFNVMGIGCGIGTPELTQKALLRQISQANTPLVLDADALNILSLTGTPIDVLPPDSVITPHPGEFKRLFGDFEDTVRRWDFMLELSGRTGINIVLKGANSAIATSDGRLWINSTGNPGMATAGSGDVLTGLISGLMAQGYSGSESSKLGVFWHGLAGDHAAQDLGYEALTASDIIEHLGKAFIKIRTHQP